MPKAVDDVPADIVVEIGIAVAGRDAKQGRRETGMTVRKHADDVRFELIGECGPFERGDE